MAKKQDENSEINNVVDEIKKDFGADSLRFGIEEGGILKCDVISTRCLSLDSAIGVGGIPRGRITEIFGPESSGKTTLATTIVAEAQSNGLYAAYIDVEHAVDPAYTKNIGVNWDKLLFSQPDSGEQALSIVEKLIESGKVAVIVVDSVAALVTQAELDGEMGDKFMAPTARLMSEYMRKLKGKAHRTNTALVFINQVREKVGVVGFGASKETQPGGRALKFYASVRLDIRRIGSLKEGGADSAFVGNHTRVKVVKNKVAPPFKSCEFTIIFGEGISTAGDLLDLGLNTKIITRAGSGYAFGDNKLGAGWMNAVQCLKDTPELLAELRAKLVDKVLPKPTIDAIEEDDGEVEDIET